MTHEQSNVVAKCARMLKSAFPGWKGLIEFGLHPDRANVQTQCLEKRTIKMEVATP